MGVTNNTDNKLICIAKFGRTHGVKGQVILNSFSSPEEKLFSYNQLFFSDNSLIILKREGKHQQGFIVSLAGISSKEAAQEIVNQDVYVSRDEFEEITSDDEFYIVDLEGLDVKDPSGELLGHVESVENYGAGDILNVAFLAAQKNELLLFNKENFPEVILEDGYIVCVKPEEITVQSEENST